MERRNYTDFEAFSASVRDVDATMMLNNPVHRSWSIEQARIDGVDLQLGRLGSGNVLEGQSWSNGLVLYLPLTPSIQYFANGRPLSQNHVMVLEPGCEFQLATTSPHDWCSIFVPLDKVKCLGLPLRNSAAESYFEVPQCRSIVTSDQVAIEFQSVVREILSASAKARQFETSPGADAAKDQVLRVARRVLAQPKASSSKQRRRPKASRQEVLSRCRAVIEKNRGKPIVVGDLAAAVGVSERTLRTVFNECFGMGPARYLQLRELHELRRRLRDADADTANVTNLMAECGVWEFGRCAQRYRALFGELPSQTLKKKPNLVFRH
jgi:AraC family ethanolamine operon transcriptional activator